MKTTILTTAIIAWSWQCFAQTNYFPTGSLNACANLHDFRSQWFSKHLSAMREPALPIMTNNPATECYRFLHLPTWGHPVAIRLTASGEVFTVHSTVLSGQGGYEPGTITNQTYAVAGKEASDDLRKQIEKVKLFRMSTTDHTCGCDGEEWVLEGVAGGKYCVVSRWCPVEYDTKKRGLDAFVSLCRRLLDFSMERNKANVSSQAIGVKAAPQLGR